MPRNLQKSLQDYISKIKRPASPSHHSISSPQRWILPRCKHPKTPSFSFVPDQGENHNNKSGNNDDAATLSDVDRFLVENFKSLYVTNDNRNECYDDKKINGALFGSPTPSHHNNSFFLPLDECSSIEKAARTNSEEIDSSSKSIHTLNESVQELKDGVVPDDCIAVVTYSPSPYEHFLRSMEDMVEGRWREHGEIDWDLMEEILLCYLNLNEKKLHKFILSAFVDLVVKLRQNPDEFSGRSRRTRRGSSKARETGRKVRRPL